jgi:iron complex outermembrane receptor protein
MCQRSLPRRTLVWLVTASFLCAHPTLAEEATSAPAETEASEPDVPMDQIVVVGHRSESNWLETPASISVVHAPEIRRAQQQLTLGESLGNLPGVFIQNRTNFAQDSRISIRGFGARTPFGISGIKLIVDGIPLTLPDGQGQVDSIDLSTAARIEVLRGPGASLYGSAAGGVIAVTSDGGTSEPQLRGRVSFGSDGYRSYQGHGTGQAGNVSYALGLSRMELDGYRDHSKTENVVLNTKFQIDVSDRSSLTMVLNHVDAPKADDPGALTAEEVSEDRDQASQRNVDMKSGEDVKNTTLGFSYRHELDDHHETTFASYFTLRDFDGRVPSTSRGAIDLDRVFAGGSIKHTYQNPLFGRPNRLTAGVDVEGQRDNRKQRAIDLNTGAVGSLAVDEIQKVTSVGAFIQDEFSIRNDLRLSASARYDWVGFEVDDDFTSDPGGDDSDKLHFSEWSFAGAMIWNALPALNPYLQIATAFETPTTTGLANPAVDAGGFNDDLNAQTSTHYELGGKGIIADWLRYEMAGFYIRVKDELLPYTQNFSTFYENARRSERFGFELGLSAQLHRDWRASASYTYSHFEFDKFTDENGNRFDGNRLPGVPRNMASIAIDYQNEYGFFANFDIQYIDEREADNANTAEAKDYIVANLRTGYEHSLGDWQLAGFVGVNNLTNQKYIDSLRINGGFERYFEPAPRTQVYGGVSVGYLF